MAIVLQLIALAALSALNLFIITGIYQYTNIAIQYVAFSVTLVILSITAAWFSLSTSISLKLEVLKLKLRLQKAELSPIKDLVELMKARDEVKKDSVGVEVDLPRSEPTEHETKTTDTGVILEEINPRTKKPYKMPFARRMELREKALKREANKKLKRTTKRKKT